MALYCFEPWYVIIVYVPNIMLYKDKIQIKHLSIDDLSLSHVNDFVLYLNCDMYIYVLKETKSATMNIFRKFLFSF